METEDEVILSQRKPDDPICKERLMCQLFGEFIGFLKTEGLTLGVEFETRNEEIFQCSRKILWIDECNPKLQITVYLNSLQMFAEFGVVEKQIAGFNRVKNVEYRNKIENLRYKISSGTELELIDSHQEKFDEFFADFKTHFAELKKNI